MKEFKQKYQSDISVLQAEIENICLGVEENISHSSREEYCSLIFCRNILGLENCSSSNVGFYKKFMLLRSLGDYQLNSYDNNFIVDVGVPKIEEQKIYTSGHFGSYLTIPAYLYAKGVKICAIIADTAINANRNRYKNVQTIIEEKLGGKGRYELLDATDPKLFFKLKSFKDEAFSFLIYFDGDAGTSEKQSSKNKASFNLFNKEFTVRKGIAYIAYLLNIPIQPVFSVIEDDYRSRIDFCTQIEIDKKSSREESANKIIEEIWRLFESYIVKKPEQWVSLYMAHQFFDHPLVEQKNFCISDSEKLILNANRYSIIETKEPYLFDMLSGLKFKISENMLIVLDKIRKLKLELSKNDFQEIFKSKILQNQFIQNEIFIPAH